MYYDHSTCMYYDHSETMHNPVNDPVVEMSYKMILPSHKMPSCNSVFVPQHAVVRTGLRTALCQLVCFLNSNYSKLL